MKSIPVEFQITKKFFIEGEEFVIISLNYKVKKNELLITAIKTYNSGANYDFIWSDDYKKGYIYCLHKEEKLFYYTDINLFYKKKIQITTRLIEDAYQNYEREAEILWGKVKDFKRKMN